MVSTFEKGLRPEDSKMQPGALSLEDFAEISAHIYSGILWLSWLSSEGPKMATFPKGLRMFFLRSSMGQLPSDAIIPLLLPRLLSHPKSGATSNSRYSSLELEVDAAGAHGLTASIPVKANAPGGWAAQRVQRCCDAGQHS